MKKFQITAVAILSLAAFVGCKTNESPATAAKAYPLDKCVVSGEPFEQGKAYTFIRNGQEIKLCCKDCLAEFNKDPQKFMAKLNAPKP